ncbi:MAG: (2Fe-2S) ferredoxin domain-containing protein [Spirochaetaceae bacterium]|nr:(2Fe-2S) ferredoxin domain-containing protein [Spirochaetaceae bacterium]
MTIAVCMGSSCHVKGAKTIIELLKEKIKANNLEDKVTLTGTICLGQCASGGANMKIDDEIVTGITRENFDNFFAEKVLAKLK